jgi:hypothetical protein
MRLFHTAFLDSGNLAIIQERHQQQQLRCRGFLPRPWNRIL